jgi:hypothetical protein
MLETDIKKLLHSLILIDNEISDETDPPVYIEELFFEI